MANDSNNNSDSIWLYNPNFALSIVFALLYLIPTTIQFWQTFFKYKSWYFVVVFVGACLEVAGYVVRAVSVKNLSSIPPYAVQSSFIIIAPLFIGAGNYLLISRLCLKVLPSEITHIHRIPVRILTRIFVLCDIVSFLIQVSGTGIASSQNWDGQTLKIGEDILIAGLAIQVATFGFFLAIVGRFHLLTRAGGVRNDAGEGWRLVLKAVYISSILIIIRSIYRLIEFALGIFGYPFTHEWMFYVFESVPMLPAISIFCLWHPAEYFGGGRKGDKVADIPLDSTDTTMV
ncbi:related to Rtm1p [Phialocephala subalpina]|uniref:Related to Rtm1p n=1 Tax=Phialocephala subalpina TaxID=576137 RepID=A0A1L7XC59_9HELO|nr:related to Rtm1p [Phialocephala subalpina]